METIRLDRSYRLELEEYDYRYMKEHINGATHAA